MRLSLLVAQHASPKFNNSSKTSSMARSPTEASTRMKPSLMAQPFRQESLVACKTRNWTKSCSWMSLLCPWASRLWAVSRHTSSNVARSSLQRSHKSLQLIKINRAKWLSLSSRANVLLSKIITCLASSTYLESHLRPVVSHRSKWPSRLMRTVSWQWLPMRKELARNRPSR